MELALFKAKQGPCIQFLLGRYENTVFSIVLQGLSGIEFIHAQAGGSAEGPGKRDLGPGQNFLEFAILSIPP